MVENVDQSENQESRRKWVLLLVGCAGVLFVALCIAGLVAAVGLIPIFAESTIGVRSESVAERDGEALPGEEGVAGDQDDALPEGTRAEAQVEETQPEATITPTSAPTRTPAPTNTPQPTATPTLLPQGMTRQNPFPTTGIVNAPNWDVEVLEIVRGEEAWNRLQARNQFNDPPPEGMEYLLLKVRVRNTNTSEESRIIDSGDFKVTGSQLTCYSSAPVVVPQPELDAELATGGETTGWIPFLIPADESNLMLLLDELFNFDDDRFRYIALDDGAVVEVDSALADIAPTEQGTSRQNTIALGETAINENWEVTVLEVIRGEEVWNRVQAKNQFNEPPRENLAYVLMRVNVRNISTEDRYRLIDEFAFNLTGSLKVLHRLPSVVTPDPVFDACLYPGGQAEGWVTLQAGVNETDLMAVFEPTFDGVEPRFLALKESASVGVSDELDTIPTNDLGVERQSPAPFSEMVVTEEWEVAVKEVIRGEQAWTMTQEANQFNDPPAEGMEYIAVRVEVRYIGMEDNTERIDGFALRTIGDLNVKYDAPSVVEPKPAFEAYLYPGGRHEGWAILQAAEGENNVALVFNPGFFGSERYLSLEP